MPHASASKTSVPKLFVHTALLCFLVSAPLGAQYGGPLCGGGGGIPIPWGHKKKKKKNTGTPTPTNFADGKTGSNDGKKLIIANQDGRRLIIELHPQAKFTLSGNNIARKH